VKKGWILAVGELFISFKPLIYYYFTDGNMNTIRRRVDNILFA